MRKLFFISLIVLRRIIDRGKEKAQASAENTIREVRHVIGYRN